MPYAAKPCFCISLIYSREQQAKRASLPLILCVLQRQEAFFSGTDLYYIFYIIQEEFTVAHLTGVKNRLGGINNFLNRDEAYDDLDLDLRQETHLHGYPTVICTGSFLYAASHYIGYGDAGNADLIHRLHKIIQFVLPCDDDDFRKLMSLRIGITGLWCGRNVGDCRCI